MISEFGHGHAHWVWGDEGTPIKLDTGQKPGNPPLSDVVVQGNIVYDSDRDRRGGAGPQRRPRYRFAVQIASDVRHLRFNANIMHPGSEGISNRDVAGLSASA